MQCGPRRYVLDCRDASYYERQIEYILGLSGSQTAIHLRANGTMYHLIGTLLDTLGAEDPKELDRSIPDQAKQYMELHYHNRLQIADVADALGVHVNYLANLFQKQYSTTPKQYLSELRVKKAKKLLLDTDHPVYIVANSVGFSDPLTFSKFFHRMTGMAPTAYREQGRRSLQTPSPP